jgi:transcriptional regulator with PAS, ATPase and Fis domain
LLRALETRRIRPVGASREVDVDVRIIAATNRDLWSEVRSGTFREDLFFRLQVFPILLPPLRERAEDVLPLAEHLLRRIGASSTRLDDEAITAMCAYRWPGNVRELLNVLRRCVLFADGPMIDGALMRRMLAASVFGYAEDKDRPSSRSDRLSEQQNLAKLERAHIDEVLSQMEGNVTRAASALGIDRRTLQRKLKRPR